MPLSAASFSISDWNSSRRSLIRVSSSLARKSAGLVEIAVLAPGPAFLHRLLEQLANHLRTVVHPEHGVGLGRVFGATLHRLDIALDEAAGDGAAPLLAVSADLPRGDGEAGGAALQVPGERTVADFVEIVDRKDRHVVAVRHDAEIVGVHVAEQQHGRHPGVGAGHVAIEQQGAPTKKRVDRAVQFLEFRAGALGMPVDALRMVLEDAGADVLAAGLAGEDGRQHHGSFGLELIRQPGIGVDPTASFRTGEFRRAALPASCAFIALPSPSSAAEKPRRRPGFRRLVEPIMAIIGPSAAPSARAGPPEQPRSFPKLIGNHVEHAPEALARACLTLSATGASATFCQR